MASSCGDWKSGQGELTDGCWLGTTGNDASRPDVSLPAEVMMPKDTPAQALWVTIYLIIIMLLAVFGIYCAFGQWFIFQEAPVRYATFSICAGIIGGGLNASRWVVYTVRHSAYEARRLLWQVVTPVHSGIFAGFGLVAVHAGLVTITSSLDFAEPGYILFVLSFSFIIGFSSELFVKRLIKASEALFGEHGDLLPEDSAGRTKTDIAVLSSGRSTDVNVTNHE